MDNFDYKLLHERDQILAMLRYVLEDDSSEAQFAGQEFLKSLRPLELKENERPTKI